MRSYVVYKGGSDMEIADMVDRQTNTVLLVGTSRGLGLSMVTAFICRG